jgi:simple sugar transport system ATP-binding protein
MSESSTLPRGPRLELEGASKRFGELWAVRELSLALEPGRIHAVIGENGAGKSTALRMLAGHLVPTSGAVHVGGEPLAPPTPHEAMRRGVGMVHQHFMLVEALSALDNLVLGHEPVRGLGRIDLGRARARARAVSAEAALAVDLDARTSDLAVGERQRLEILRVLYRGARAVLLDEPTAVLSPAEVGELYATLRRLADGGATVAVVTHRLDEVVRWADEVTVLRRGRRVHAEALGDDAATKARLTRAIMGGEPLPGPSLPPLGGEAPPALALAGVRVLRANGTPAVDGVDLSVRAGEIVGVAGVEGNGQRELVRALAGLEAVAAGSIALGAEILFEAGRGARPRAGLELRAAEVARARGRGLVVVHEDRHRDELLLEATVADNLVLGDLEAVGERERAVAERRLARFGIDRPEPERLAGELSGGNQQKLVLGRALDRDLRALVLAQPTRGVDVGAASAIQRAVAGAAAGGAAVLLVSADLGELCALSHRIVVMRRGRLVAEMAPTASEDSIGRAMLGGEPAEGAA